MSTTPRSNRPTGRDDAHTFETTYADEWPPSEAVVRTVSAVVGQRPDRLYDRLFDVVDPDALDRLFDDAEPDGEVGDPRTSFVLANCHVTLHGGGSLVVQFPVE